MSGVKEITFTRRRLEELARRIEHYAEETAHYEHRDRDPHDYPSYRDAKRKLERMLCVPLGPVE